MKRFLGICLLGLAGWAQAQGTDRIATAPVLDVVNNTPINGSTAAATADPGEVGGLVRAGGHSVWFRIHLTVPATFNAKTQGSNFDTTLAVYRGAHVSEMREIASNDDVGGGNLSSEITTNLRPGTYYMAIDGFGGASGNYTLAYQFAMGNAAAVVPPNDAFASAQVLPTSGNGGVRSATTMFASIQGGEPGGGGSSVWFRYDAAQTAPVVFRTYDAAFDPMLHVYTGAALNALTLVASNDDVSAFHGNLDSEVTFNATGGTTYWIRLAAAPSGGQGTALLTWGPAGMNGLPTLDASYSGAWWDSSRSGEGYLLEIADHPDPHTLGTLLNFTWYTYDTTGNPVFLFGAAVIDPTAAPDAAVTINLFMTRGARFGAAFNPADVVSTAWGQVTLRFLGCNQLYLTYAPGIDAWGADGERYLRRVVSRAPGNLCP
jgi:hypothetical protein